MNFAAIAKRSAAARAAGLLVLACLPIAGCGSAAKDSRRETGPPEVGFVVVHATSAPIETELSGRVAALRTAEVRPQISGVIQERLFTEGALVRAGQPLYRIDQRLYAAAAAQAQANLAAARANAEASAAKAARYRPLAEAQAVSQQDYTDAAAAARAQRAAVAQNAAQLQTAQINLKFTTVPAPLTGRIGRSLYTQGALVTSNQTDPLAVISVLDPIYVDVQQSSSEQLRLRKALTVGGAAPVAADVRLILDDGSEYGSSGRIEFSEVTVDPATGTTTMRARFPNPQNLLLPGMFVRARFAPAVQSGVFLVPQEALTRDPRGRATVWVVVKDDGRAPARRDNGLVGAEGRKDGPAVRTGWRAELRDVTADRTSGAFWVVTAGLKEGDQLVTQGLGKLRVPGPVRPVPATTPQRPRSGKPGNGGPGGGSGRGAG